MKHKIWLVILLLMVSSVKADLTADIHIETEGDVISDTYLETDGGDINYNSDVDAQDYTFNAYWSNGDATFHTTEHYDEQNNYHSGLSLKSLANWFSDTSEIIVFGETKYGRNNMKEEMLNIMNSLSLVFVTKPELQDTNDNTLALHYRLEAVEKTLEKLYADEYCESKLEVMRDYGLEGVSCGDWEYSISGTDMIIGVKKVKPEVVEPLTDSIKIGSAKTNIKFITTEKLLEQWQVEALAQWEVMCSNGMDKFCVIAENNRKLWGIE